MDEKRALANAVGPVWDGNEVWLLAGGGALFAVFPMAYATVFSGFYLALMLVLFALILRGASLEFRAHDPKRKGLWDAAFVGGSLLPSLLFGVALGNVIVGVPLDARTEYCSRAGWTRRGRAWEGWRERAGREVSVWAGS